jgi:uncharacterized protein
MVRSSQWLMGALIALRDAGLPEWAVTSGAIRNLVWDRLHGYDQLTPVKDVDVAFLDPTTSLVSATKD